MLRLKKERQNSGFTVEAYTNLYRDLDSSTTCLKCKTTLKNINRRYQKMGKRRQTPNKNKQLSIFYVSVFFVDRYYGFFFALLNRISVVSSIIYITQTHELNEPKVWESRTICFSKRSWQTFNCSISVYASKTNLYKLIQYLNKHSCLGSIWTLKARALFS